jgi:hypothetical protein
MTPAHQSVLPQALAMLKANPATLPQFVSTFGYDPSKP